MCLSLLPSKYVGYSARKFLAAGGWGGVSRAIQSAKWVATSSSSASEYLWRPLAFPCCCCCSACRLAEPEEEEEEEEAAAEPEEVPWMMSVDNTYPRDFFRPLWEAS